MVALCCSHFSPILKYNLSPEMQYLLFWKSLDVSRTLKRSVISGNCLLTIANTSTNLSFGAITVVDLKRFSSA